MVKMKFSFRINNDEDWHELPGEYEVEDPENFSESISFKYVNAETSTQIIPAWFDVTDKETDSRPTDLPKRGRPALEPTDTITVRLPVSTLDIIKRRAAKANMGPSIWLAERVIHHEVVRSHHPKAKRKT